jgi:hypothetical protein
MGEFRILGPEGDTKTIWDPENEEEVEIARETFDRLTKKGYNAFNVDAKGKKSTRMEKFDPSAGKIILTPPVVGG